METRWKRRAARNWVLQSQRSPRRFTNLWDLSWLCDFVANRSARWFWKYIDKDGKTPVEW